MTSARAQAFSHPKSGIRTARVNHALCVLLGLVFLTAAIAKTQSFRELEATLVASRLVPILWVRPSGIFLLVIEYLLSVLLVVPMTRRPALYASSVLVSVFAAYSLWRWKQGIAVPCHCFGVLFQLQPWQSLLMNGALLATISYCLTTSASFLMQTTKAKGIYNCIGHSHSAARLEIS
jgi:hypothetical protein